MAASNNTTIRGDCYPLFNDDTKCVSCSLIMDVKTALMFENLGVGLGLHAMSRTSSWGSGLASQSSPCCVGECMDIYCHAIEFQCDL